VGTAIFVAVILGATQARANTTLAPVAIGLTLAVVITVALPLTNASINPARSTAAVFFAEPWAAGQLWLFWVAPLLGAAVAGLVYRAFAVPVPAAEVGLVSAAVEEEEIEAEEQARQAKAGAEFQTDNGEASAVDGPEEADGGNGAGSDAQDQAGSGAGNRQGSGTARPTSGLPGPVPADATYEAAPTTSEAQDFFDNPQPRK